MSDRSVRARDITHSVVVTGDGNIVTVTFGDSGVSIPVLRKQFPPPERAVNEPPRELDLLVPETGTLPLIGRQGLLAELRAWLDKKVDISVHALIGPAGSGKTRLAIGLCQAIDCDPDAKDGWIAGFLLPGDLSAVVGALATRSFAWERPTLLVIDNAAQCQPVLTRLLDRLASQQKLDTKLRILLLDREAPEGFGWWHELTGSGPPGRRKLFHALRLQPLPDLSELEERRELISAALQAARDLRPGEPAGAHIPAKGKDPGFDRRLAEPQFGNPLALVMAGVIALDRDAEGAMALRHLEAARWLAHRELDRLAALAESRGLSGDVMRHIVAFNGLVGGIPTTNQRKVVTDELTASHLTADLNGVLTLLKQELPPLSQEADAARPSRFATIRPDLIGEAAIIEIFTGPAWSEVEAAEVVRRAYGLSLDEAGRVLVHLVQDFGYPLEDESATSEEKATARRVVDWLLNLMREIEDPEQMLPLVFALPAETTILREAAADLTQRLVSLYREKAERADEPAAWIMLAGLVNNLAARLSDLGRREEALTAAEEAVRHYRALAAARPDAFTPNFAASLGNLANRLSALGRREEALTAAEEAVRLRRALAAARPDAFTPDLAVSLNILANRLSALGRREEALTAAEEAVRLRRALAAARPDAFTPDLAGSLNNLANMLSDLGRREEALTAAEEAVRHYRALAAARPEVFGVDLARSLWVLGDLYGETANSDLAIAMLAEGVRLLTPIFLSVPAAVAGMISGLVQRYLTQCKAVGREPDAEMLGPVIAEFERLSPTEEEK